MAEKPVKAPAEQEEEFTTTLKTLPVKINGETWTIREITGPQRNQFLDHNRGKMDIKKKEGTDEVEVTVKSFEGQGMDILMLTLYKPTGEIVSPAELDTWPANTILKLAEKSMTLSGLNKKGEEQAKNSSTANSAPGTGSPAA